MKRGLFRSLAASFFLIGTAASSNAAILYATNGAGRSTLSNLYTIDTTTGAATLIGATGFGEVAGIDFDPTTGILYGVSNTGVGTLITINTSTGAGTAIATLSPDFQAPDLAFSSSGTLYSWSEASLDHLNIINKTTGATTDVGPSGVGTANTGLGFAPDGTLYMKSGEALYNINSTTGAATFDIGFVTPIVLRNSLVFDSAGEAYSLDKSGNLYLLNVSTGNATDIGPTGVSSMSGLAFAPMAVAEPAVLPLFASGLIGLGLLLWRRQRKQAAAA